MATQSLQGKKIAILATDGFEQSELLEPRSAFDAAGAATHIVSLKNGQIRGWSKADWGERVTVDATVAETRADDYDALLLPGGVMNPDKLRTDKAAVAFVKAFFDAGKPVAAICHGPWTIVEAGAAKGRRMTSWPSLQTDLRNAGATWVDEEVVVDGNLVTSRKPDDIAAFNAAALHLMGQATARA